MKTPRLAVQVFAGVVLAGCVGPSEDGNKGGPPRWPVVRVASESEPGHPAEAVDLAAALGLAGPGTRIELAAGVHVVHNPLRVVTAGVTITGQGLEATVLRPRHPGRPLLVLAGDGQGIERMTLEGLVAEGEGRASHGVRVEDRRRGCRLRQIAVVGAGSSGVAGMAGIQDCRLEDSFILDAGNDAVQLRGSNLRVTGSVLMRYFDEAVDVNSGSDIVIHGNCMADGRIGVTMTVGGGVVTANAIRGHPMQGIYLDATDGGGVLSGNLIVGSGEEGLVAVRPRLISGNRVQGAGRVGIRVEEMRRGIILDNVVEDAPVGYALRRSTGNLIHDNVFAGAEGEGLMVDAASGDNRILENRLGAPDPPVRGRPPWLPPGGDEAPRSCREALSPDLARRLHASLARRHGEPVVVQAASSADERILAVVAEFLDRNNPGYVSLELQDGVLVSEITADLLHTLRGSGDLGVGLFRWPVRLFGRVSGNRRAEWSLRHGGAEVARVRRLEVAPGAAIALR